MTSKIIHSDSDPFLTTKEAAQCLGVTLRTVQLWVEAGKLQAARTPGGHRRIRTSDVRSLQEHMGIRPAKPVVLLTPWQFADALGAVDAKWFGDQAQFLQACRAIEAADIAARAILAPAAAARWLHQHPDTMTTGAALIAGAAALYLIHAGA